MAKLDMLMPQMGESITEGTVIRWLKKVGDTVARDEIILEISTDKVDSEIPSPFAGKLVKLLADEGETVSVGAVIAEIEGEAISEQEEAQSLTSSAAQVPATAGATATEIAPQTPKTKGAPTPASGTVDMQMPQMGESITEGTIIRWLKNEGDTVHRDEIVLEISTDKVDSEIPSPFDGKIAKLLAGEGDTVAVGVAIARIETAAGAGAEISPAVAGEATPAVALPSQATPAVKPAVAVAPKKVAASGNNGERRFYSPLVRKIAQTEGVSADELARITGSGAHGRVTKADILSYLQSRTGAPAAGLRVVPADGTRTEIIPMDSMRRSIAAHMVASVQTSPHVFAVSEADMTNIVNFRARNKDAFLEKAGTKLTYMPFIVKACVNALLDFPLVNSSVQGDNIIRKKYINIGIAVALENNGLIVPVVKNADGLNSIGLARQINDLADRARAKKLKPDEVQGGTFSITNMGGFGSLLGLPIINQPQVAILGVGAIQKRAVVINDAIAIRSMMYISLSFDHRVVDGALGGQFLERIAHYLTNFDTSKVM